jgi:prepilin-type N-terminal cleavage/methylation domain-containing protein
MKFMQYKTYNLVRIKTACGLRRDGSRHGFTLVELLVTMTAGSMLLLLAIEVLHRSMTSASHLEDIGRSQSSWARLGNQLRHDVHGASRAELVGASALQLHYKSGAQIEYLIDGTQVRRVATDESTDKQANERYRFNSQQIVSFQQWDEPPRVEVKLDRQVPEGLRLDGRVVAFVGRMLALEGSQSNSGVQP